MTGISKFLAEELATTWETQAELEGMISRDRKETLRECADVIRMLANRPPAEQMPETPIAHRWTFRLARIDLRTPIERSVGDIIGRIEHLGGHPLLTAAQMKAGQCLCILGAWEDAGKPGAAP